MSEIEPVRAWGVYERELSPAVAAALAATQVVKVIPVDPPRIWRIETDSRVGVLVGEGWELRILPHIEISKLLFLLTYSLTSEGWEGVLSTMADHDDLVQALAYGFCLHTERVLEQGLLSGYLAVQERRSDLRGRVRFGDQIGRLAGMPIPIEVAYDDFTTDIVENRLLAAASRRLLSLPRIPQVARARLLRSRAAFEHVSAITEPGRVQLPAITRLNRRYEPALTLAKLILDGTSISQERGHVATRSFLFDMNEVFESFLFTALSQSLRSFGGVTRRQVQGALDRADSPRLRMRADIVWYKHGAVRAVIDSKYKSLEGEDPLPNEDAYQMLAYCIGFGVRRGLLVYACDGHDHTRQYEVKRHEYEIDVRSLDLRKTPAQLLEQIDLLAADIAAEVPEYLSRAR